MNDFPRDAVMGFVEGEKQSHILGQEAFRRGGVAKTCFESPQNY